MANEIKETVTISRPIDPRLQDMIRFARTCSRLTEAQLTDDSFMARKAGDWWDMMHGE